MKIGFSSYSFLPLLRDGTMSLEQVFDWSKEQGAEHIEIVAFSLGASANADQYDMVDDGPGIARLRATTTQSGLPVSGICIAANFLGDEAARTAEIARVKRYVDLCADLGVGFLRHDVVTWSRRLADTAEFEREFASIAAACTEVADHAAQRGVVTSIEDHGFFMNGSDRVKRLLHAVNRPNFRMTLDVGNFLCVDEDPLVGTRASLQHAAFVHVKDFYVRRHPPGPTWLKTYGGQHILGSVFGFGDLPTATIVQTVAASGFDGFVSLEFEGNEPALFGCETGFANLKVMVQSAKA